MSVIPVKSLRFPTEDSSDAARNLLFLEEIDRQAEIASWNIGQAWKRGMQAESPRDVPTWSYLQGALFASIVVDRLLFPKDAAASKGKPSANQLRASDRARKLRLILDVDHDEPPVLRTLRSIRDDFEHFDERLDAAVEPQVASVVDWYIGNAGAALMGTQPPQQGATESITLRAFYPSSGLIVFGETVLDLFTLDRGHLQLREFVQEALASERARVHGRGLFAFPALRSIDNPQAAYGRAKVWLDARAQAGVGLAMTVVEPASENRGE